MVADAIRVSNRRAVQGIAYAELWSIWAPTQKMPIDGPIRRAAQIVKSINPLLAGAE
jgi:hypothetical protein